MVVEVSPNQSIDILRNKVHFFKTFAQRKYELIFKDSGKIIDDLHKGFREYGVKDGTVLVLRE